MSLPEPQIELPDYLPQHLGGVREPGPPDEVRMRLTPLAFARASQMLHRGAPRFGSPVAAPSSRPSSTDRRPTPTRCGSSYEDRSATERV
jgi:hypothetical protein